MRASCRARWISSTRSGRGTDLGTARTADRARGHECPSPPRTALYCSMASPRYKFCKLFAKCILPHARAPSRQKCTGLVGGDRGCIIERRHAVRGRAGMSDTAGCLFERLVEVMATLRGPQGCPWDREQTRDSLKAFLIEEACEVLEALDLHDPDRLEEELGDLLLQVIFHAQVAAELGEFTVRDVLAAVTDKLIRRHPHVFGEGRAETAAEVLANWERLKQAERGGVKE